MVLQRAGTSGRHRLRLLYSLQRLLLGPQPVSLLLPSLAALDLAWSPALPPASHEEQERSVVRGHSVPLQSPQLELLRVLVATAQLYTLPCSHS